MIFPPRLAYTLMGILGISSLLSCTIPDSGSVQYVDPANIPYELNTPSSTTITPSTSTSTSIALPVESSTPETSTIPVESVSLFFVVANQVIPIERFILSPVTPTQVLLALSEGLPEGDVAIGLRNALPDDFLVLVDLQRGIATVDLSPTFSSQVPGVEQRLAIAQIVLTLTRRSGIGQVAFTTNGVPQIVPRGRGDLTSAGDLVTCEDYSNLLPTGFSC